MAKLGYLSLLQAKWPFHSGSHQPIAMNAAAISRGPSSFRTARFEHGGCGADMAGCCFLMARVWRVGGRQGASA